MTDSGEPTSATSAPGVAWFPNSLTVARFFAGLAFPFVPAEWWLGWLLFGGITDLIDGWISRMLRVTSLFGQPGWYKGIMTSREQKMNVVDTAQWVMPGQHLAMDDYNYLIMLGESPWGLACHQLKGTELLHRDQVKWRHQEGKRPWLAGMVKEKMCALLHVRELLVLLGRGVNIEGR